MKYDPKKLFGYPVLRDTFVGEDKTLTDYPKSEFQPDISLKRDPKSKSKAIIDYEIAMSVPELIKKIDDGLLKPLFSSPKPKGCENSAKTDI